MSDHRLISITFLFVAVAIAAIAFTPSVTSTVALTVTTDARPTETARDNHTQRVLARLAYGTATDQVDLAWHDYRDLASGAVESLNLNTLTDDFGAAVNLQHVKAFVIENKGDTVLTIGSGSTPVGFAPGYVTLPAGGAFAVLEPTTGWAASGANLLRVQNDNTGTGSYKLTIAGTSS